MDKRDLSALFRQRLARLVARSGQTQSAFADGVHIDRSALSQLLSGTAVRLPRAETLLAIAERHGVSLDWLLGLSQDEGLAGELRESMEIEEAPEGTDQPLLARWHAEAAGTKIRYVPARIPDLLRTEAVIAWETSRQARAAGTEIDAAQYRLDYSRRPETDMEVAMPCETLETFAAGAGVWKGLSRAARREQIDYMADHVADLYPTFRLFLFDGRSRYSVPYTVFGQIRVAIFAGDMYLVLNAVEAVRTFTRHFDGLIRAATVHPHEAAKWIRALSVD